MANQLPTWLTVKEVKIEGQGMSAVKAGQLRWRQRVIVNAPEPEVTPIEVLQYFNQQNPGVDTADFIWFRAA